MDRLVIEGGQPLKGTVEISGAKNAVLPTGRLFAYRGGISNKECALS